MSFTSHSADRADGCTDASAPLHAGWPAFSAFGAGVSWCDRLGACSDIRTPHVFAALATIVVGLYVDEHYDFWGQMAVGVCVWTLLLTFIHRIRCDELRAALFACLIWVTAGEMLASLVWGLYRYRLHNVPLFIPPGHVLMLLVALYLRARVGQWVVAASVLVAVLYAASALYSGHDMFSVVLTPLFLGALVFGRSRKLYAITFLMAIPLELYGTWMGNWRWEAHVPGMDLTMANPPICVGAIYCLRDALVSASLAFARRRPQRTRQRVAPSATQALT